MCQLQVCYKVLCPHQCFKHCPCGVAIPNNDLPSAVCGAQESCSFKQDSGGLKLTLKTASHGEAMRPDYLCPQRPFPPSMSLESIQTLERLLEVDSPPQTRRDWSPSSGPLRKKTQSKSEPFHSSKRFFPLFQTQQGQSSCFFWYHRQNRAVHLLSGVDTTYQTDTIASTPAPSAEPLLSLVVLTFILSSTCLPGST